MPKTALACVENIQTQNGLRGSARILDKLYEIGRKGSDTFRDVKDQFIRHDDARGDVRGQWNYLIDANGLT